MTKSDQVYTHIKEKIVNGELAPGDSIRHNDFAETLQVSKIPFREAIKKLEANGYVEVIHNTGAKVRKPNLDELEQIMLIRLHLEVLAAGLAAEQISDAALKELKKLVEEMDKMVAAGDKDQYCRINRDFHMLLYKASNADFLTSMIEELWDRSEKTGLVFTFFPERFEASNVEHKAMLACMEKRDREGVEDIIRKQKKSGYLNVIRMLKECENLKFF